MGLKEQGRWTPGLVLGVRRVRATLEPAMEPKKNKGTSTPGSPATRGASLNTRRVTVAAWLEEPGGFIP